MPDSNAKNMINRTQTVTKNNGKESTKNFFFGLGTRKKNNYDTKSISHEEIGI